MGLEATQLEINTLGHVFCALIIYMLWWHKPRLVKEPTTLAGDWVGPLCAYIYEQPDQWREEYSQQG